MQVTHAKRGAHGMSLHACMLWYAGGQRRRRLRPSGLGRHGHCGGMVQPRRPAACPCTSGVDPVTKNARVRMHRASTGRTDCPCSRTTSCMHGYSMKETRGCCKSHDTRQRASRLHRRAVKSRRHARAAPREARTEECSAAAWNQTPKRLSPSCAHIVYCALLHRIAKAVSLCLKSQ